MLIAPGRASLLGYTHTLSVLPLLSYLLDTVIGIVCLLLVGTNKASVAACTPQQITGVLSQLLIPSFFLQQLCDCGYCTPARIFKLCPKAVSGCGWTCYSSFGRLYSESDMARVLFQPLYALTLSVSLFAFPILLLPNLSLLNLCAYPCPSVMQ